MKRLGDIIKSFNEEYERVTFIISDIHKRRKTRNETSRKTRKEYALNAGFVISLTLASAKKLGEISGYVRDNFAKSGACNIYIRMPDGIEIACIDIYSAYHDGIIADQKVANTDYNFGEICDKYSIREKGLKLLGVTTNSVTFNIIPYVSNAVYSREFKINGFIELVEDAIKIKKKHQSPLRWMWR